MTQAVILAGGKGTRLAERLNGRPKPLIDVCGVPLLQRQIEQLSAQGVGDFVIRVAGYVLRAVGIEIRQGHLIVVQGLARVYLNGWIRADTTELRVLYPKI